MPIDVFISYSHKDNVRVAVSNGKDPDRWVDWFHERFAQYLSQLLRRRAEVWRDLKLRNDDELTDEIRTNLGNSTFLVPILSPSFTGSNWCPDEVQMFLDFMIQKGSAEEAASYIHPVGKLPVPHDELPAMLTGKLGIAFYHQEEISGRIRQWDPTDPEMAARFSSSLYALCHDISDVLSKRAPLASGPFVFLPLSDRVSQIPRVRTELKNLGYRVIDSHLLKHLGNQEAFLRELERELDQSQIVVMLPGLRPYVSGSLPVERLQWEAIETRLQQGTLKCLAWTDDKRVVLDSAQEQWIDALGAVSGGAVELLKCSFQQFLADLGGMLARYHKTALVRSECKIIVVVDHQESDSGHPLLAVLLTALQSVNELEVEIIQQDGLGPADLRERKQKLIPQADAMVLFSARSPAAWLKAKDAEVVKLRPELAPHLYYALTPEGSEDKKALFSPAHSNFVLADSAADMHQMIAAILKGGAR